MSNIYVHIGCEKTSSTTVQACFERFGNEIFGGSLSFPSELFQRPNQMELSSLVLPSKSLKNMMVPKSRSDFKESLVEYLRRNSDNNIYLTSEHLSSRVGEIDRIVELLSILTVAGHRPVILAFYREPFQWIFSHYKQYVSCGGFLSFEDYISQSNDQGFIANTTNYGKALCHWAEVASEFNGYVRYRSYEASASDLLNNFFIIADLSPVPGMEEIASNPSMTDSQVIVQRWVNLILRKRRMTDFLKRVITNMPL